jgi:hypothetical protein
LKPAIIIGYTVE